MFTTLAFAAIGIAIALGGLVASEGEKDGVVRYTQYGPVDGNGRHRHGYFHRF